MSQPLPFSVALKSHWWQGYLTPICFDLMCVNRLRLICHDFDLINLYRCSFHQGELEERRNWNFHWEGYQGPSPPAKPSQRLRLMCHAFDLINLYRCNFHQEESKTITGKDSCAHEHLPSPAGVWFSFVILLIKSVFKEPVSIKKN